MSKVELSMAASSTNLFSWRLPSYTKAYTVVAARSHSARVPFTCQSKETMRLHFQGQIMHRLHKQTSTASAALVMSSFRNGKRHKLQALLSTFRM